MKRNKCLFWILVLVLVWTLSIGNVALAAEWPFRHGEVIRLTVPFGLGGGFDRITRLLAPFYEKYLNQMAGDKKITVIVENIAGAAGRIAMEDIFHSTPDGTRLVLASGPVGVIMDEIRGANYILSEYTYIGQVNESNYGFVARSDIGVNSLSDLVKRSQDLPILWGTTGFGGSGHSAGLIMQEIFAEQGIEFNLDYVFFDSTAEELASMQRGEEEATFGSIDSLLPFTQDEEYVKEIVTIAEERSEYWPEIPTVFEEASLGSEFLNTAIAEGMVNILGAKRVFVGPPNIPDEIANILREALKKTMEDPDLLDKAKTAEMPIIYRTAEEAKDVFMFAYDKLEEYYPKVSKGLEQ
jgi:tripartite-type tricarboxylate transporter receptor subunit TctC